MTSIKSQKGLTLIEVAVAIAIMAIIFVLSQQAISVASASFEISEKHNKRLEQIDRAWFYIRQDLQYILAHPMRQKYGDQIPPFRVEFGQESWMTLLRSNNPNPLSLLRTEKLRVAYKYEDEVISRHTWPDPADVDWDEATEQKILSGVERLEVRVLPPTAKSLKDRWPDKWIEPEGVPLAVEITLELKDRGEMKRVFTLNAGT